jgi:hypothetical protein
VNKKDKIPKEFITFNNVHRNKIVNVEHWLYPRKETVEKNTIGSRIKRLDPKPDASIKTSKRIHYTDEIRIKNNKIKYSLIYRSIKIEL